MDLIATAPTSDDGQAALADIVGDDLPTVMADLIEPSVQLDGSVAASDGVLTSLPTSDGQALEIVSLAAGAAVSFSIEGMSDPEIVGDAVVADTGEDSSVMVHATENGTQIVAVANAPEAADLSIATDAPDGAVWTPRADGGLTLVDRDGTPIMIADAPWAIDANGTQLPTSFTVDNEGTITQHVNTDGATFPVASDPSVWWWIGTAATCAAQVGSLVLGLAGTKVAGMILKAEKIIAKSVKLKAAINAVGGIKPALTLIKKAATNYKNLTALQRARLSAIGVFGAAMLSDIFGIGSCVSLVKAL